MDCVDADAIAEFWRAALPYEQPIPTAEEKEEALRLHPDWATKAIVQDER